MGRFTQLKVLHLEDLQGKIIQHLYKLVMIRIQCRSENRNHSKSNKQFFKQFFLMNLHLAVCPNHKVAGDPNYKKINSSIYEHKNIDKHVERSDQQMGAVHPVLSSMGFNFMKVCTIILILIMTLALKVLVLFTIRMPRCVCT